MIESSRDKEPKTSLEGNFVNLENVLRPVNFGEYIGQKLVKENLRIAIEASNKRKEPLDHVLLHGGPGLGKTTLAHIISREMGASIKVTSGPALEKQGDIASIISNLKENDILFIDEIHRLKPIVEEVLYTAMEDFGIDLIIGKGPSARTMRIELPKFTLIGATTKLSMISSPLRARFGNVYKLELYDEKNIAQIILRSANLLGCTIAPDLAAELAKSCRQTPRIANRLLKRVRDYSDVKNSSNVTMEVLKEALHSIGIDDLGLEKTDRDILQLIIENYSGGPVGLNTLSAAILEEKATIEDIYEPYLIKLGLLERTNRGRVVTEKAYRHLNIKSL